MCYFLQAKILNIVRPLLSLLFLITSVLTTYAQNDIFQLQYQLDINNEPIEDATPLDSNSTPDSYSYNGLLQLHNNGNFILL